MCVTCNWPTKRNHSPGLYPKALAILFQSYRNQKQGRCVSVFPHQLPFPLSLLLSHFSHINYSQVNCCWCLDVFYCKSKQWCISFLGKSNWEVFQAWASGSWCALTDSAMALVHPGSQSSCYSGREYSGNTSAFRVCTAYLIISPIQYFSSLICCPKSFHDSYVHGSPVRSSKHPYICFICFLTIGWATFCLVINLRSYFSK